MRKIGLIFLALVATVAVAYRLVPHREGPASFDKSGRRVLYYVDPMHPNYKSDRPGTAPDCGMALEAVYAEGAGQASATPPTDVHIDEHARQLMGIRVAPVEKKGSFRMVRAVGRVQPEDTRVYSLNSGVDGFVRETDRDSVGTTVTKNQKLATYYAPEFLAAASGFLAANERVPGSVTNEGARSIQNYTDRLRNLGMSDQQIKRVAETHQLPESIEIVSPVDGVILARNISPGQHFGREMSFYQIADLSRVWVSAEIYQQDQPYLRPGMAGQVTVREAGRHLAARVADSLPQSNATGGTVELRLAVDNPHLLLRPQMLVDVELPVQLPTAVTVPADALVDAGARALVYVESAEGQFEPREVQTGWRSGDLVEIRKGVQPGERVVVSATFLVDAESRLRSQAAPAPTAAGRQHREPPQMAAR